MEEKEGGVSGGLPCGPELPRAGGKRGREEKGLSVLRATSIAIRRAWELHRENAEVPKDQELMEDSVQQDVYSTFFFFFVSVCLWEY